MQIRPAVGTLAVVALLVTAGCSGPGGSVDRSPYDVPSPTPSPTVTPTPTETFDPSAPVDTVVPGVTEDRIVSLLDLVTNHTGTLSDASYRIQRSVTLTHRNGTTAQRIRMGAISAANGTKYVVYEEGDTVRSVYISDEDGYVRTERGSEVSYAREDESDVVLEPNSPIRFDLSYKAKIYRYLRAMSNVSVEPSGSSYVLTADDVDANYVDILVKGDVSNVTVRMAVTPDGLVEGFRTRYTLRRQGVVYEVEERIRFSGVGEVTVPVPPWLSEARDAVGERVTPDR